MDNGEFAGIVVAFLFCMFVVALVAISNKRKKDNVMQIVKKLDESDVERLNKSTFSVCESNYNFLVGTSYIYEIEEEQNRVRIGLLFHHEKFGNNDIEYQIDSVYISKSVYQQKNYSIGNFVSTLHNRTNGQQLKVKEII